MSNICRKIFPYLAIACLVIELDNLVDVSSCLYGIIGVTAACGLFSVVPVSLKQVLGD